VVSALVTIGETLKKERNIAHLQIATSAQFLSNLCRNVLRPAFGGVESNYPDRIAVLACKQVLNNGLQVSPLVFGLRPSSAGLPKSSATK
jgi:hypothetical protein